IDLKLNRIKQSAAQTKPKFLQEEAFIATRSAASASAIRSKRSLHFPDFPGFINRYAQIAEIDELHKLKAKLENYKEPVRFENQHMIKPMQWAFSAKTLRKMNNA